MEVIDTFDQIIDEIVDNVVSEFKECTKCGITKLKNCFSKRKASKDGLQSNCKDCKKVSNAKYYQENRDEILAQKAEYEAKPERKAKKAEYNSGYYDANKDEIKAHKAKPETKTKKNRRGISR